MVATKKRKAVDERSRCCICLDALLPKDPVVPLSCGCTAFHAACIVPWLQQGHRSCPLCRAAPARANFSDDEDDEDHETYAGRMLHRRSHMAWDDATSKWQAAVRANFELRGSAALATMAMAKKKRAGRTSAKALQLAAQAVASFKRAREKVVLQEAALALAKGECDAARQKSAKKLAKVNETRAREVARVRAAADKEAEAVTSRLGRFVLAETTAQAKLLAANAARSRTEDTLASVGGWRRLPVGQRPLVPQDLIECTTPAPTEDALWPSSGGYLTRQLQYST